MRPRAGLPLLLTVTLLAAGCARFNLFRRAETSAGVAAPRIGQPVPEIDGADFAGNRLKLSDYRGKRVVVLYFYPKDDTPGCTAEACAFRDSYEVFTDAGAEVIGVSSDSVRSHERFGAAYQLPFTLVSDERGRVRKSYGVKSSFGLLPGRVTYVIDRDGIVHL